jgi:chromosome segregation ATPase
MRNDGYPGAVALAAALALALAAAPRAEAQKIVCWKDKSGKVVGCGDKVPPEFQDSATQEMDRAGVTRKTTESAEQAAKRKALEAEQAKLKAEEEKRRAEQKRQDMALLNTYTNEKEIDQRRDRDLQVVDLQISQLQVSLKNANDRYTEARTRHDAAAKSGKPVPDALRDELARATADKQKLDASIAGKEKEKEEIRARYAEQKKRYNELRGTAAPAPAPAAPAAAPAAKK